MADIQKLNVNNTTYDISTTWEKVTGKPSTFTPSSHSHQSISPTRHDSGAPTPKDKYGLTFQFSYNIGLDNWWNVLNMRSYSDNNYTSAQIATPAGNPGSDTNYSGDMYWRQGRNSTWSNWKTIIDSSNISSYALTSLPSHTHTFASLTSKPTTLSGYGITDAYTSSTIDSKLSGYLPLSGGVLTGKLTISSSDWNNQLHLNRTSSSGSWGPAISFDYDGNCNGTLTMTSNKLYVGDNGTTRAEVSLTGHTHTKSQITDFPTSMPASDVYSWAKASSKPTYTYSEVGAAAASHSHSIIVTEGDNRNVATKPNDYINRFVFRGLKTNSNIGSPSSATYSYLIGLRGWSDSSGGDAHELAFNNSGIFRRQGSTTEWGSWYKLIDTGNFTKSLVEGVLTGNITSHTHDDRYYTESEINTKLSGKSDTGHTHSYLPLSGGTLTGLLNITTNGITATYGAQNNSWVHFENSAGVRYYFSNSIHVNGDIKVYNTSWGITSGGRFDGSGFYQSSDERLKTFYEPIKVDLEKLRKLRKNYFKFNDKNELEIGVSAQEIQNIYPEIVSTDDNGYLSVAYDKLSVIALAAIDELDDKILQLANKISTLENILNKLMGEKGVN